MAAAANDNAMALIDILGEWSILSGRGDPVRVFAMLDALKQDRADKKAVEGMFGPATSRGPGGSTITWDTPRPVEGASPEMQKVLQNPLIGKAMQGPTFRQKMFENVMQDLLPKPPAAVEFAPGTSYGTRDPRTGAVTLTGKAPFAPSKVDLVTLKHQD